MLAQGRFWRVTLSKGEGSVLLSLIKESLPEELRDLRELQFDVPLSKWNRVVKHVRSDRKLLGGILLDFAKTKDHVSTAVGSDRLYWELQRVVVDTTASLIESGALALTPVDVGID
jgi:hypothetical protein